MKTAFVTASALAVLYMRAADMIPARTVGSNGVQVAVGPDTRTARPEGVSLRRFTTNSIPL